MVLKAFKFRCFPNKAQQTLIRKTFGCSRLIFNQLLAEQKEKNVIGRLSMKWFKTIGFLVFSIK